MELEAKRRFGPLLVAWLAAVGSPKYLSQGLSLYVAMYAGFKFVLLLFGAADASDRWVFELTPAFLLNLPDAPLLFLGAILAGVNAHWHASADPRHRREGMLLSAAMAVSLWLALWAAGPATAGANSLRFAMLLVLLANVTLDRFILLAGRGAREGIEAPEAMQEAPTVSWPAARAGPADSELDYLRELFGETDGRPATAKSDLDRTLQDLDGLAAGAAATDDGLIDHYGSESTEIEEALEEARFAAEDLDTFARWLDLEPGPEEDAERRERSETERKGRRGGKRARRRRRLLRR